MQIEHRPQPDAPFRRAITAAPLYLAFAATGVGVALPGVLLPSLLVRWRLGDEQGGRLFLMAWIGSSIGALMVRGSMRSTLLAGSLTAAAAAFGLGLTGRMGADACMALYGVGLGLTMTSISLIRQRTAPNSGTELVRLNLLWAIGACACPSLALRALSSGDIRPMLWGLAACFAVVALWTLFQPALTIDGERRANLMHWNIFRKVPAGLIAMTMLITGIEASAGGWLTTYARREGHALAGVIAAPTCFWAGLLLSRLFWSVCPAWLPPHRTVRGSLSLMCAAAILLVTGGSGVPMLSAAFGLGFGIGPVYPTLLAWALQFQRGGTIFFLAGVGSACLPWLTGLISAQRQSLRIGLLVPMAGTIAMLALSLMLPLGTWSHEGAKLEDAADAR